MLTGHRLAWPLVCALLLATSCSSLKPTSSPPSPSAVRAEQRFGAPIIPTPRTLRDRVNDPCGTLLTRRQLEGLGFREPGQSRTSLGVFPECTWTDDETGHRLSIAVIVSRDLFVDSYRSRLLPVFRPTQVLGAPAVQQQTSENSTSCTTTVGVADAQSLDVVYDVASVGGSVAVPNACVGGARAAAEVISTLPPL